MSVAGDVPPLAEGDVPVSFLIDFDGTISLLDVGDTLLARHFADVALAAAKDAEYERGEVGSRELMQWDMDVLPHDPDLLRREAAGIPTDVSFPVFAELAQSCGAAIEIVSDGLGFYIDAQLAAVGSSELPVATNANTLLGGGAGMSFPFTHPHCFVCGNCKRERVRRHRESGRIVVFIGDGASDRYAANHSDLVFAKDQLADFCDRFGIPYRTWVGFEEIAEWLASALDDGSLPAAGADVAAWRATHGVIERSFICGPEVWGPDRTTPPPTIRLG